MAHVPAFDLDIFLKKRGSSPLWEVVQGLEIWIFLGNRHFRLRGGLGVKSFAFRFKGQRTSAKALAAGVIGETAISLRQCLWYGLTVECAARRILLRTTLHSPALPA